MNIETTIVRVQTPTGDDTPSPVGMELAAFCLRQIPTGGLTVVNSATTLVGEAVEHVRTLPIIEVNPADDALVDGLLSKARTKTWRPIGRK